MDVMLAFPATLRPSPTTQKLPLAPVHSVRHFSWKGHEATLVLSCGLPVKVMQWRRCHRELLARHARKSFECFPSGEGSPDRLADLFLQLPLRNGVLLSGVLARDPPKVLMPPLAIVPRDGAACIPFEVEETQNSEALRHFHPGPLLPESAPGKALQQSLQAAPEEFEVLSKYEHMRAWISGSSPPEEQAEVLLLEVYRRFQKETGAPPRPKAASVASEEEYDLYIHSCKDVSIKALHGTCSPDFCMIAEAHVLGLAKNSDFPRLKQRDARAMYASAMRFGYAVRQAEIRHQADGVVGTFVPLPVEAEMCRKELESLWARPAASGTATSPSEECHAGQEPMESNSAAAAHFSLQEVFNRLKRIGEARPGLATYLGWLGKFDPEALSILSTPTPTIAWAMKLQADAVWGTAGETSGDEEGKEPTVASTPADMLEATLFGAWLHDAEANAQEVCSRLDCGAQG
ncbi:unnamed protein product [Durusdinium trenchii]|uniref:Uncharacterized protein n=2 Tax=Durusdinium trenchii TaxID=1381693 RepID=A0ABP0HLD0_9DINO